MKPARALILMLSLAFTAFPVAAQERESAGADAVTASPLREAAEREAARLAPTQPREPAEADWSRVMALTPGTEIAVTVSGAGARQRWFVAADPSSLKVSRTGDLDRVETILRNDVVRITRSRTVNRGNAALAATGGAVLGLLAGYRMAQGLAYSRCGNSCRDEEVLMGLSLIGGPVAGGVLAYHAVRRKEATVVYRAP